MNREKKLSVRMAAVGGAALRQELRAVGMEGDTAMQGVASSANAANVNLEDTSLKAARARDAFEQMSVKAAAGAASIRMQSAAASDMQAQINRLTGVTSPTGQTTAEFLQQGQALDDLRAKYNPVFGVVRQYRQEVSEIRAAHLEGALSADEMAAAISRSRQSALASIGAYKGSAQSIAQMSRASRGATLRLQQMFFQVNDIGVSLAGGMNPFVVMAQQGTQIAQIYGFGNGGVGGAFKDLGRLVGGFITRVPVLTAAVAAFSVVVGGMRSEINQAGKETVSFGDTAKAVFQVIGGYIYDFIEPAVSKISEWFDWAWDGVIAGVKWAGNGLINGMRIAIDAIRTYVGTIPDMFLSAFGMAVSNVLTKMHDMVWYVGQAINGVAKQLNETFGTNLGTNTLGGVIDTLSEASGAYHRMGAAADSRVSTAWDDFQARTSETWGSDPMGQFFDDVAKQARENARKRKEKKKSGGNEADEVQKLVEKLQMELKVLRETDPIKKKMLQYSDQLASATREERQAVEDLVIQLDSAKNGWEAVTLSLAEYAEDAGRIGDDIGDALVGGFKSAEDAFRQFATNGKVEFKSLVGSMIADLATLTFRKGVLGPVADALSGALKGSKWFSSLVPNENGNAFHGGRVIPFADGGVVTTPTFFPMRGATGLMGEAGAEAIMPLTRAANGKLGVRSLGQKDVNVTVDLVLNDEMLDARVREGAENVSIKVTREFNRSVLPGRVLSIVNDPRRRN